MKNSANSRKGVIATWHHCAAPIQNCAYFCRGILVKHFSANHNANATVWVDVAFCHVDSKLRAIIIII